MVFLRKGVKMKALIFDSGALINLSMNGMLYVLKELKKNFDGKFLITEEVKYETVDRPIGIERFELGALQVQSLIDSGIIELPVALNVNVRELKKDTKLLFDTANRFLKVNGKWLHIVAEAEMSCLALSSVLKKRGIETMIAIDERTTRILCENPSNLGSLMSERLHQNIKIAGSNNGIFSEFRFIRSSELLYVAYKKNIIELKGKKVLEAVLLATKFKGSSISFEEINVLKKYG